MDEIPFAEFRRAFEQEPLALLNRVPGVLPVDKPEGMTSHDAVALARRRLRLKKIGHGGTLDPMATGLLLLLLGRATRLFDALQAYPKTYRTALAFGYRTDTHDRTGETLWTADAPRPVTAAEVEAALTPFRGEILQTPPMFSALKKDGRKLYELARRGEEVEREARPVTVYDLRLLTCEGDRAELEMTVSSGFYVRTLVDDLGQALGVGAVMTDLRRTAVGPFTLDQAVRPEDIAPDRIG